MSSQKLSLSPRPSGTIYQDLSLSGFRGRGEPAFRCSNPSRLFVCEAMEGRMLLSAVVHIASDLVAISAPVTASITGYTLVNSDADTDIGPLTEGITLDLSKLPRGLNVRTNTTGPAKSVRLTFDNTKRLELQAPWALFGDWFGDYVAGSLGDGSHTITAQAFTGTSGSGTPGPLNILHIRVINQPPVAPLILIQGTVYNDVNASKTRDAGDTPLAGVKVYVDFNMDGTLDAGEPTAVTDSSGTYRFGGLLARSYVVAQVVPIGYRQLVPAAPYGQRIYAPPGGTGTVAPFADHLNSGVLSGTIYKDLNLSGLRSLGEPGLAGIRAYLDLNKDGIWQGSEPSVLSATDGSYRFTGLAPGTYTLRIIVPSGWKITGPYWQAYTRTLNSDYAINDNDFGIIPLAPVSVDPAFGVNGQTSTSISFEGSPTNLAATAMALQRDGKILVVGAIGPASSALNSPPGIPVLRYNSAGTLDATFGTAGIDYVPLTGFATAVIQQPDGKILVAGESNGHFSLTRLTAPGALDPSFGVRGSVITTFGGNEDRPNAISLLPDGRILLAGMSQTASSTRTALAQYLPNGMPDQTFGVAGVKLINSGPAAGGQGGQGVRGASAVAILPSGQIEIAGTTGTSTKQDWFIARLNSNGAIDPTFGTGGVTVTDFGGGDDVATGLALTSDGRAIVVGSASVGGIGYSALAFYTSGGALDTSRGNAGKVLTNFGMNNHLTVLDAAAAVSIQPDGRIVVAGTLLRADNFGSSIAAWTLARYTPTGALETPFGTTLIRIRDASQGTGGLGAYDTTSVSGLALQADGKIVLAGTDTFGGPGFSEGDIIVSRFIAAS